MYYCYILFSKSINKHYIGITENVYQRLNDHNTGISKWTKNNGPWVLVWQKEFPNLSEHVNLRTFLNDKKEDLDSIIQL